jgi:NitT/TauT family transport system substrate-binding protein
MDTNKQPHKEKTLLARKLQLGLIMIIVVGLAVGAYLLTREDKEDSPKSTPAKTPLPSSTETTEALTDVTLFMGYIPSVQFAPVYVALEKGYFEEEGIRVSIENGDENDGVLRLGSGDLQFGLISGEQVILAHGQGLPIVYIMEWFHSFPVGVVSPADLNITTPEDLKDRVVGIPGPYGASYMGFRALLGAAGMSESDLKELRSIGYTAPENVCEKLVDAAVVYIANEPYTIERDCMPVNVIKVSDYVTLVSNGLVTNEETLRDHPELARGMTRAILRGLQDVLSDPDAAFAISVPKYVPDLAQDQYETQRQVLKNSLALWQSDDLGHTNPAAWEATQKALLDSGLLPEALDDLSACYNMDYLP